MRGCIEALRRMLSRRHSINPDHIAQPTVEDDFHAQVQRDLSAAATAAINADGTPAGIASQTSSDSDEPEPPTGIVNIVAQTAVAHSPHPTSHIIAMRRQTSGLESYMEILGVHLTPTTRAPISPRPSWVDLVKQSRLTYDSGFERVISGISLSPKKNIIDRCADPKLYGVNYGWLSRKTEKAKHPYSEASNYNGKWLVKVFAYQDYETNYTQTMREFVYANLLAYIEPSAAPKTRIALVDGKSYVASKFIPGFKALVDYQPSEKYYSQLYKAIVPILIQSILLADTDLFVMGNFGFVEVEDDEGEKVEFFKNIDFDRCGYFTKFAINGYRCNTIFDYILYKIEDGLKIPGDQKFFKFYLEGLVSHKFKDYLHGYHELNHNHIDKIISSSCAKFFELFPTADKHSEMKKMNNSLHQKGEFISRSYYNFLVGNIIFSVQLQVLMLEIWGLFIDSLYEDHAFPNAAEYAKDNLEEIMELDMCKSTQLNKRAALLLIDQLHPAFIKVCILVSELRIESPFVAAAAEDTPTPPPKTHVERFLARRDGAPSMHTGL